MADIETDEDGEYGTGGTWLGGVKPGVNDRAIIKHKCTITNTDEYCRILRMDSTGELEINATSSNSNLHISDHADAKISFNGAGGIIDLNGTSVYKAQILQDGADRITEFDFTDAIIQGDWGVIDYVKAKNGYIDWTDATLTLNNTLFKILNKSTPRTADRWYFKGVPTSSTISGHTEFEGIYYRLWNANYEFNFTEDPSELDEIDEKTYVEAPVTGREASMIKTTGFLAERLGIVGVFNGYDNRWLYEDLKALYDADEQYQYTSPRKYLSSVRILLVSRHIPKGNPYRHEYEVSLVEDV